MRDTKNTLIFAYADTFFTNTLLPSVGFGFPFRIIIHIDHIFPSSEPDELTFLNRKCGFHTSNATFVLIKGTLHRELSTIYYDFKGFASVCIRYQCYSYLCYATFIKSTILLIWLNLYTYNLNRFILWRLNHFFNIFIFCIFPFCYFYNVTKTVKF